MLRPIEQMQVVSVDATKRRLICQFQSATGPGVTVRMGVHGPADGVRVRQGPMPTPGTWGLVAFPGGDSRSGVWMCAVYTSDVDAFTGDGDPYTDYHSHWSGAYDLLDGHGQKFGGLPDGTYWSHSVTPGAPVLNGHVVNTTQNRVTKAVTPASLVTSPPAARPFRYHHASGTQIDIATTGQVTIAAEGGCTVVITPAGAMSINLASGQTLSLTDGGSASDALALVSKLVAAFNSHTHSGVQTGSGNTGNPVTSWSASTIQSALAKTQA